MNKIIEELQALVAESAEFNRQAREEMEQEEAEKEILREGAASTYVARLLSGAKHLALRGHTTFDIKLEFEGGLPRRLMNPSSSIFPAEEVEKISCKMAIQLRACGFREVSHSAYETAVSYGRHFTFSLPPA